MKATEKPQLLQIVEAAHSFYKQDFSKFAADVWWQSMVNFDLAAVADALGRHVMNPDTGQFCPKPADVVRMLAGTTVDSAHLAWSKVDVAVRSVGPYQSVCFDDALINYVLSEMGGWVQLCNADDDEWPFKKNEFVARYRGFKGRNETPKHPKCLIGISESQNAANGEAATLPILLGDATKAMLVHDSGGQRKVCATPMGQYLESNFADDVMARLESLKFTQLTKKTEEAK